MSGKTVILTLTVLALFSTSCTTWRRKEVRTVADWPRQNQKVLSVVKACGEYVRFAKSDPGLMYGNVIYGLAVSLVKEAVEVEGPFRSVKKRADGRIYEVTDRNGQLHSVHEVLKDEGTKLTCVVNRTAPAKVSFPVSEARLIQVKETNVALTLAAIACGLAVALPVWMIYSLGAL